MDGLSFEEQAALQKALYASLKEQKQSPQKDPEGVGSLAEVASASDQQQVSTPVKRPASPPLLTSPVKRPRGRPRKHPKPSPAPELSQSQPPRKVSKKKVVIIDTPSEPTVCHTPPSMSALQNPQQLRSILLPTPEPKPNHTGMIAALASLPMAVVKPLHSTAVSAAVYLPLEEDRPVAMAETDSSLRLSEKMEASRPRASQGISDGAQHLPGTSISKLSLKHYKSPPSIFKKSTGSVKRRQPPLLIDMSTFFSSPSSSSTCGFDKPEVNRPAKSEAIKHPVIQTAKKSASICGASHENPIPYIPDPSDDQEKASQSLQVSSPPSSSALSSDSSRVVSQSGEDQEKCSAVVEGKPHSPDDGVAATSDIPSTTTATATKEQDKSSTSCPNDDLQKSINTTRYRIILAHTDMLCSA